MFSFFPVGTTPPPSRGRLFLTWSVATAVVLLLGLSIHAAFLIGRGESDLASMLPQFGLLLLVPLLIGAVLGLALQWQLTPRHFIHLLCFVCGMAVATQAGRPTGGVVLMLALATVAGLCALGDWLMLRHSSEQPEKSS